jgi:hypothetical protein
LGLSLQFAADARLGSVGALALSSLNRCLVLRVPGQGDIEEWQQRRRQMREEAGVEEDDEYAAGLPAPFTPLRHTLLADAQFTKAMIDAPQKALGQ